jgi:hypothetical protein
LENCEKKSATAKSDEPLRGVTATSLLGAIALDVANLMANVALVLPVTLLAVARHVARLAAVEAFVVVARARTRSRATTVTRFATTLVLHDQAATVEFVAVEVVHSIVGVAIICQPQQQCHCDGANTQIIRESSVSTHHRTARIQSRT